MMFKKIRDAKSNVDNVSTIKQKLPPEPIRRLKQQQLDEDRRIKMERENRRLIESISKIVAKKPTFTRRKFSDTAS